MRRVALAAFTLLLACAGGIPDHVELTPEAQNVDVLSEAPSPQAYKEVGRVTGAAVGPDVDTATEQAKNDLRNKAAALGASLVTIDQNHGVAIPLSKKMKVELSGRAYKPVD